MLAATSLVFACSSSESEAAPSEPPGAANDASAGDAGGEGEPGCKEAEVAIEAQGEKFEFRSGSAVTELHTVAGVYTSREGVSVLTQRIASDRSGRISIVGPGSKVVELASVPDVLAENGGRYTFVSVPITMPDGKRCAVFAKSGGNVMFGCEGGAPEDSGIKTSFSSNKRSMNVVVDPSGKIDVYTQAFAALALVQRDPAGTWREIEQFESSISWPEDAVSGAGGGALCFIATGDRAVLKLGAGEIGSTEKSATCRIALDGATVHVATDNGYAAVPTSRAEERGATFVVTPVAGAPAKGELVKVVMAGSVPFAVYRDDEAYTLRAVALMGTATRELGPSTGVGTFADPAASTLYLTSQTHDSVDQNGPVPQTIRVKSLCTNTWK